MTPDELAAIRVRLAVGVYNRTDTGGLLEEVDRLTEQLAEARGVSDGLATTVVTLRRDLAGRDAAITRLRSALERTEGNFRSAVNGKPVRDMAENLAENRAALDGVCQPEAKRVCGKPVEFWTNCSLPPHSSEVKCVGRSIFEGAGQ